MARKLMVEIVGNADSLEHAFKRADASSSRLGGTFSKISHVASNAGLAIAAGLVVGVTKSVEAAQRFQSSMELLQTQAGASTTEVKTMSAAVLGLAGKVGTAPEELAKGLYHVESAGFRGAKALSILKLAAEGAAVGHSDLEQTTTALVAAQRSGIKGLGDMSHSMGSLNAIVGAGNMRMDDLTSALGTGILPTAKAFGASITDVGAALATMTSNGIPAVNAASGLKMMLASMAAPTKQAAGLLKSVGISSTDLADTVRKKGLFSALSELKTHMETAGLTATQQAALLSGAFGKKSSTGLLTLIGNLKDMKAAQDQVSSGASSFGANWAETQKSSAFATAQFHAALSALEVKIGAALLPTVTKATTALSGLIDWLSNSPGVAHVASIAFGVFKDVLDVVTSAGERLLGFYRQHETAAKVIIGAVAAIALAFASPVVVITAVGVALIELYKRSETFRNIVNAAFQAVHDKVLAVMPTIKAIIVGVVDAVEAIWRRFGGLITSVAQTAFVALKGYVTNGLQTIAGIFTLIGDLIHGRWSKIWGDLVNIVSHQLASMWSLLHGAAAIAGTILYDAGKAIIQGLVHGIESMAGAAKDAAVNAVKGAANAAKSVLGIHSPSKVFHEMGVDTMLGYINGIESTTPKVRAAIQRTMGFVSADARRGVAEVITTVEGMWEKVASVTKTGGGSGVAMTATQYRNADGAPLADWWVQQQVQASLDANPNASTGAYMGPVIGDQYGAGVGGVTVPVTVMLDNDVLFRSVQRTAAKDVQRGGTGVPG